MSNSAALSESEVKRFVDTWYHSLDIHVSLETFLAMVADDDAIEFRFPEVTVTDMAGLTAWYKRVTTSFFDEIHQTVKLAITVDGDSAAVKLVTHWQAST